MNNIDNKVIHGFSDEWKRFDQSKFISGDAELVFDDYFSIFPWEMLPDRAEGFDMGCGTGRWAFFVAPKVGLLNCIDPSDAIDVARKNLADFDNIKFHRADVDSSGLNSSSQDFGYSLGVVHHIPNTQEAIKSCVRLLKPGAPLLLYIYYALDNRPFWYRAIWKTSDNLRWVISRLPNRIKNIVTDFIAIMVYWPLSRACKIIKKLTNRIENCPLDYYANSSFYVLRTDARDRFGTHLEKRFTKLEIEKMMAAAGLKNIKFSARAPFWCVVGYR